MDSIENFTQLKQIQLKNFRCFSEKTIEITKPVVLIEGNNGEGKTSLFEALYYACYLRSFRTHSPRELIHFGENTFFIKITLKELSHEKQIQVGFSHNKRLVKIDQNPICSYKELINHYRVISLTEDDLALIQGSPQERRSFLDYALVLSFPDYINYMREFQAVLEQRNALLRNNYSINKDMYMVLTEQLWLKSCVIQKFRLSLLHDLQDLIQSHNFFDTCISLHYNGRIALHETFESFCTRNISLYDDERHLGRSLFGSHLDDFNIIFKDQKSKSFASRGQQKLIVLLIKISYLKYVHAKNMTSNNKGALIFFLDDFMTDFDSLRSTACIDLLLDLPVQLMFSSPIRLDPLSRLIYERDAQVITLTD